MSALQDFLDLGKITFRYSGFSCSTWTQNIEVRGLLTEALFHISWILVQKDALQILTCWCSSVAWLVLVSHVILLGNVDQ